LAEGHLPVSKTIAQSFALVYVLCPYVVNRERSPIDVHASAAACGSVQTVPDAAYEPDDPADRYHDHAQRQEAEPQGSRGVSDADTHQVPSRSRCKSQAAGCLW
jgi:hypothetical protein